MDGLNVIDIICECGNTTTGSYGVYIDTDNGEIVCKKCGLVSDEYYWQDDDVYEI